jgi:Tfp pilus assembly protein PilN
MIKINLLRDTANSVQAVGGPPTSVSVPGGPNNADAVKKLLIIGIFPLLVYAGFFYFETQEAEKISLVKKKIESMKGEVEDLQPQIKAVKSFQEEKKRLEVQVEAIKQLSKERLLNVMALSTLQDIMPKEVWLKKLKVVDRKVELTGSTISDRYVTDFLTNLNASIYFRNTILISTREEKGSGNQLVKAFDFQSEIAAGK